MDTIGQAILKELEKNGRATASEISKIVNLSIPAVSERIKKLEGNNIIEKYTVKINREIMGYELLAIIFVNIEGINEIRGFREKVITFEEVLECHHMAGEYDYMLKVLLKNTKELESFVSDKLKGIKGVQKTNTIIGLSTIKEVINR